MALARKKNTIPLGRATKPVSHTPVARGDNHQSHVLLGGLRRHSPPPARTVHQSSNLHAAYVSHNHLLQGESDSSPKGRRQTSKIVPTAQPAVPASLARNLLLARHVLGITQDALALESGVSRATIAQIERGDTDCRLGTLSDLSAALGIFPALLLLKADDLTAFVQFVREAAVARILAHLPTDQIQSMNQLNNSGLPRDYLRVAVYGVRAAAAAGYRQRGAAVGAGIGSTVQPGLGTAVGALMGFVFDSKRTHAVVELEDGGGI